MADGKFTRDETPGRGRGATDARQNGTSLEALPGRTATRTGARSATPSASNGRGTGLPSEVPPPSRGSGPVHSPSTLPGPTRPPSGAQGPVNVPPGSRGATTESTGAVLGRLRFARPDASPKPDHDPHAHEAVCARCEGRGYEFFTLGEWSRARVCGCQDACLECKGKRFVLETRDDGYTYHTPCACQTLQRRIDRFNQALIPSHFAHKNLNNFERNQGTELAYEHVRHYARGYPADKTGILLVGPPGVGKTHLVVSVLKVLTIEKGIRCLFKDFFLLLSEVKAAYETGRFESEVLRPLTEVDVLVIDELGKGRTNSDWEQGLLDEIVCKRYNQMKTTILTTNFPLDVPQRSDEPRIYGASAQREGQGNLTSLYPKTLEERIGERIFSRLKQMCMFLRVEASDYRRTHAAGGGSRSRR